MAHDKMVTSFEENFKKHLSMAKNDHDRNTIIALLLAKAIAGLMTLLEYEELKIEKFKQILLDTEGPE